MAHDTEGTRPVTAETSAPLVTPLQLQTWADVSQFGNTFLLRRRAEIEHQRDPLLRQGQPWSKAWVR